MTQTPSSDRRPESNQWNTEIDPDDFLADLPENASMTPANGDHLGDDSLFGSLLDMPSSDGQDGEKNKEIDDEASVISEGEAEIAVETMAQEPGIDGAQFLTEEMEIATSSEELPDLLATADPQEFPREPGVMMTEADKDTEELERIAAVAPLSSPVSPNLPKLELPSLQPIAPIAGRYRLCSQNNHCVPKNPSNNDGFRGRIFPTQ